MKLTTIKQSRGAAIRFRGECIASTSFDSRGGPMMLEIWETERGALIPVTRGETPDGRPDVRAAMKTSLVLFDTQIVDLSEDFDVGGEHLSAPGDPRGSAGSVINCRCTIGPVGPGIGEGD